MEKELEGLETCPKVKIHFDLLRVIIKKVPDWKASGMMACMDFGLKKFTLIHDRPSNEIK